MFRYKTTILMVLSALLAVAQGQVVSDGACPDNVKSMESFDVEKYLGTWYEYSKYPVKFEANGKCITAKYTLNADGTVQVKNRLINTKTNTSEDIEGFANLVSPGKLLVQFPVSPAHTVSSNYWVLKTDYDNYAVVYSCNPMGENSHSTIVWILTRERIPRSSYIERAISVLYQYEISLLPITTTDQASCDNV
ncbi:apolipoprotein D [Stomoxys calcitrans]|uniref:apolipoprotein D n=1 Tax=Stomoxys calcitrans TaxID=35570 RepID=UPI0027E2B6B2|nr:apolipoprotein D [Stomoxys calcitrans]